MAIGVRDSEERVTGGLKLMTGANFVFVKAISPTVEEMKSVLGFDEPKAPTPSVDTDAEGNTRVRLDFWLSRPEDEFLYRESFFITKKDVVSQSGKVQFVNNFAQFCYADPEEGPQYEWFNKEGLRNKKEFVNHKILDCIGDLYTSGYRIIGSVKCSQGGHSLTNQILRKLFRNHENFSIIEIHERSLPNSLVNKSLLKAIA